jgi:AdoMet-dependent heme synthase
MLLFEYPPGESAHGNGNGRFSSADGASSSQAISAAFRLRPSQVTWEMTRECKWKAVSCRPAKRNARERAQVSTAEAFHLIEDIAAMRVPLLALTGGDPLCRSDLFPVIEFASKRSVRTSLTLLPTPKVDRDVIADLKEIGLMRVGLWLHGSTAELHDARWGIRDRYRRTLEIIESCHEVQLPVHINTIVERRNLQDIDPMFELLTRLDVGAWNVFFFVPSSPEERAEMLSAEETEQVFAKLYEGSGRVHFQVKTTEGQHYQRYLLQQRARETKTRFLDMEAVRCAPKGVNDSRGSVRGLQRRGVPQPLPAGFGGQCHSSRTFGTVRRVSAVHLLARCVTAEREVRTLPGANDLRRITSSRLCGDGRSVRRGAIVRVRTEFLAVRSSLLPSLLSALRPVSKLKRE